MSAVHPLLRDARRALGRASDALQTLESPQSRLTHEAALADLRSALLDLQDAAEDAYTSLPEGVSQ
jgi:hypothetical protein